MLRFGALAPMPSGSGASASARSSSAERSSYRNDGTPASGARTSSAGPDAVVQEGALRRFRRLDHPIELVEVVQRLTHDVGTKQATDLVAVERVDRVLLLPEQRQVLGKLRGEGAIAAKL